LVQLRDLEIQRESLDQTKPTPTLSAEDRARLMTLGKDLAKAWNSPGASIEIRKKIIRLLVKEIIVDVVDDKLALVIHWQGGDHTEMTVKKNKVGHTRWTVEADVVDLVRVLARQLPDMAIAAILNRSGKLTGRGATWTRTHVRGLRTTNGIATYREGERAERGEATLDEAADILRVSRATAYRMVLAGVLPAQQLCAGAPWIIRLADLQQDAIRRDAEARRSRRPISQNPLQNSLAL
jgi:excisionase family DNA binding protein